MPKATEKDYDEDEEFLNDNLEEDTDEDDSDSDEDTDDSEGQEDSDDADDSEESEGEEDGDSGEEESDSGEESSEEGKKERDDREAIRERRRQERKLKKQRAHEREEKFRRELAVRDAAISQLQQQLGVINKKNFTSELSQLDNAIDNAAKAYDYYKAQLSDGAKANDGEIVAEATEKMYQSRQAVEHYSNIKKAILTTQNKPPSVNPRIQNYAKSWCEQNKWYDPSGSNIDSRITLAIDDSLAQEGYDPSTEEYWKELTNRVKKYIPHRANVVYNKSMGAESDSRPRISESKPVPRKPKSVVTGSGRESSVNKGEYQLSAERKNALKDAGLWDDPKARQAAIKRFKEYDQIHGKS